MYLAKKEIKGAVRYFIRETFAEDGILKSRTLFDLGDDPARFIRYPGGYSYYIDEAVELTISRDGFAVDTFELEDLFWPFVDERISRSIERTSGPKRRGARKAASHACGDALHMFDRRRLHFLRTGSPVQKGLERMESRLFRKLRGKSRDEIECLIDDGERSLRRTEKKLYVYSIFHLRKYFPHSLLSVFFPGGLDQDMLDDVFLRELCRLNEDASFFPEGCSPGRVHEYLVKYVIMYFDNVFYAGVSARESFHGFGRGRTYRHRTVESLSLSRAEACRIFHLSEDEYASMSRRDVTRTFRKLAHERHPDKGGSNDAFVALCAAYRVLLEGKRGA